MKLSFGSAVVQFATTASTTGVLIMIQPATAQQNSDVDQAQVDLGKAIFAERCSHCHGPNMVNAGTITPDLRRFPDDKPRFLTTVEMGKNGRMPPWGDLLNDDDLAHLWAYISSQRKP
jgi:mono/diheme cytochrome c family protein